MLAQKLPTHNMNVIECDVAGNYEKDTQSNLLTNLNTKRSKI